MENLTGDAFRRMFEGGLAGVYRRSAPASTISMYFRCQTETRAQICISPWKLLFGPRAAIRTDGRGCAGHWPGGAFWVPGAIGA